MEVVPPPKNTARLSLLPCQYGWTYWQHFIPLHHPRVGGHIRLFCDLASLSITSHFNSAHAQCVCVCLKWSLGAQHTWAEFFCKVTFKHHPQSLSSCVKSLSTLRQLLKIPPFVQSKTHGSPNLCDITAHARFQNPWTTPFGRKVNMPEK
jgi:hypothetical protein